MYIDLDRILIDETLYPRNQIHWQYIEELLDSLRVGDTLPPVVVGKRDGRYVLIEGRHRYEAHRRKKLTRIAATVAKEPESQWFRLAVELNTRHGHGLSYQEKLSAGMQLSRMKFSADAISKIIRIPIDEFEKAVAERGAWSNPEDIKPIVLKAPLVKPLLTKAESGNDWKKEAKTVEAQQSSLTGQKVQRLAHDLTILISQDYVESDNDETIEVLVQLQNALTRWLEKQKKLVTT
jgi:hypothetical protein